MSFRLALVGHGSSIREIQEIVAETFENIETVGIEMPSDERVDEAAQALRRCLPELDGVLYTRSEPYKLMVSRRGSWGGAGAVCQRRRSQLRPRAFDRAEQIPRGYLQSQRRHAGLCHRYEDVSFAGAGHGSRAAGQHQRGYQCGAFCRRNGKDAPRELPQWPVQRLHYKYPQRAGHARSRGHPLRADGAEPDNYISEVRRLILSWHVKEKAKEGSVIIRIHAELSGDYYLNRKTMVQSVLDLAKLAEQIVLFAQLVSGAYLRMGEQDFAVICSYEVLSDTTDRFSHFDLLAQVYGGTPYRLAVGIGTGLHFQQALVNAELGTQRAWEEGSNRAYLVYAEDRFVGPIQPNELMHVKRSQFDPQLLKVAQDCALSNNTVLKISTFVQRKNNGTFFTAELAEELHISFRTAARIVEKLEQNGYIVEVGRSVLNGRGRPTRVFQLLR